MATFGIQPVLRTALAKVCRPFQPASDTVGQNATPNRFELELRRVDTPDSML